MAGSERDARSVLGLLKDRDIALFLAGKLLSSSGAWIQNIAAAVLMFELTRSALMVGLVSTLQFFPTAALALLAGMLSDRVDRRRLLMWGRGLSACVICGLSLLLILRGVDGFGGPPVLLAVMGLSGVGWAISMPPMQALIPALVPPADLEQALATNAAVPSLARTVGPVIGAGLLVLGGPALAFGVAGAGHVLFVVLLMIVRPRPVARLGRASIFGGLGYLWIDRRALWLIVGVAMLNFGADPVLTLSPSLANSLDYGEEAVGFLVTTFGAGAVFLSVALRRLRRLLTLRLTGIVGYLVAGIGLAVVAFSTELIGALVGFFLNGVGWMMATVSVTTRIQRRVPEELRGRVMALWSLAFLGCRPVAALASGWIADEVSLQAAFLTAAVLTGLSAVFSRVSYPEPLR